MGQGIQIPTFKVAQVIGSRYAICKLHVEILETVSCAMYLGIDVSSPAICIGALTLTILNSNSANKALCESSYIVQSVAFLIADSKS